MRVRGDDIRVGDLYVWNDGTTSEVLEVTVRRSKRGQRRIHVRVAGTSSAPGCAPHSKHTVRRPTA